MRRKKKHEEDHVDETWLLPYSDMLTLLLALFIVMFAMSQVDNQKFLQVAQQLNAIFTGTTAITNTNGDSNSNTQINNINNMVNKQNGNAEQDMMLGLKEKLDQEIKSSGYGDKMNVNLNAEGLDISIQDTVLFNTGEADILKGFDPLLVQISSMLKGLDNEIRISGYTDNVPINTNEFHSNWDLSYKRALNVMTFMVGTGNVAPNRFSIQAYGEYSPKYDNSTEEGRAKNRSVDILIVRKNTTTTTK